jgi:hypothetical protein
MDLIAKYNFYEINLLQVDVEGYDGEVIRMVDFNIVRPRIIKYEHGCLEEKEQTQLQKLLYSSGYKYFVQGNDTIAICCVND